MDKTTPFPYFKRKNRSERDTEDQKSAKHSRFKLPKGSELPFRFLKQLPGKVARALHLVPKKRKQPEDSSLGRSKSKPCVAPVDSLRTEAIEDCIEFINSSFSTSNSVKKS